MWHEDTKLLGPFLEEADRQQRQHEGLPFAHLPQQPGVLVFPTQRTGYEHPREPGSTLRHPRVLSLCSRQSWEWARVSLGLSLNEVTEAERGTDTL